jgi:hypothetical protein
MADDKPWKAGTGQTIDKLFAWVATEPDGGEGICAGTLPGMPGMTPLIGADHDRIESFRPYAAVVRQMTGYPVRLKVFGSGVVIDEIA